MDLNESTKQFQETMDYIQEKYDKFMGKIQEIDAEINDLQNKVETRSKRFIEDQRTKLNRKIEAIKTKINEWVQQAQEKLQSWLDNVKQMIMDQIELIAKQLLQALASMG